MKESVDYPTPTFEGARFDYQWTEFLWDLVIEWRWAEQNPDGDPEDVEGFREAAVEVLRSAVTEKNSAIFRTIADILDALPEGNAKDIDRLRLLECNDLNPLRFVVKARDVLEWEMIERRLRRAPPRRLTKKEVRRLAEKMWASARLGAGGKLAYLSRQTPADREKLIQAEIECLPQQDWTKLFRKAGCADLANAPAGRPTKKKKKS